MSQLRKMKTKNNIPISIDADIFNDVYLPHLENMARTQIFYGGSASGKSVFLAQRAVVDVLGGGRNYLVCRAAKTDVRMSVFREIGKTITAWGLNGEFNINKTDMTMTCSNGYQILFAGLDKDAERLKSITPVKGIITDIYLEEATEATARVIKQLNKRLRGVEIGKESKLKRLTLAFNPILKTHSIYKEYFSALAWVDDQTEYNDGGLSILKTIYKDNKFLTDEDINDLENETDTYYYEVYTLGNWGVLGDVIFTNWKVQDLSKRIGEFDNFRNGLDFGYSNDPAAYILSHFDKKKKIIYIIDEFYALELSDEELYKEISPIVGRGFLMCDSAEPKSIAKLKKLGLQAMPAKKGKDSIRFGIKWLKGCTIIIDKRCVNFKREIEQYQWKKDKQGESLNVPVGRNDHGIDALRYQYSIDMDEQFPAGFIEVKGI